MALILNSENLEQIFPRSVKGQLHHKSNATILL